MCVCCVCCVSVVCCVCASCVHVCATRSMALEAQSRSSLMAYSSGPAISGGHGGGGGSVLASGSGGPSRQVLPPRPSRQVLPPRPTRQVPPAEPAATWAKVTPTQHQPGLPSGSIRPQSQFQGSAAAAAAEDSEDAILVTRADVARMKIDMRKAIRGGSIDVSSMHYVDLDYIFASQPQSPQKPSQAAQVAVPMLASGSGGSLLASGSMLSDQQTPQDARYCHDCNLWLNGQAQWQEHLVGRRHLRNTGALPGSFRPAVQPAPGHTRGTGSLEIPLLLLSGAEAGRVAVSPGTRWPQVALEIRIHFPELQPAPPPGARELIAENLVRDGVQVLRWDRARLPL